MSSDNPVDYVENILEIDEFDIEGSIELSEKWKKRAEVELKEDESKIDEEIKELTALYENSEQLKEVINDPKFLIKFLRAKSHDVNKAKEMITRYFTARTRFKDNFTKSTPFSCTETFSHQIQTILPHRDILGRRVFIFRVGLWDTYQVSKEDVFSANYLCLELLAQEPKTQISGITAVVDMAGLSWSHWMQMSMDYIQAMVAIVQNSFPIRFREIHIINESPIFHVAFALVKPFLTEKMSRRLQFHGCSLESLHRRVPASILPSELGGEQGEFNNREVVNALQKMEEYFVKLQSTAEDA